MGNKNEIKLARRRADEAVRSLRVILALPRRKGGTVTWTNGVVWTRVGDNQWMTEGLPANQPYTSAHVASGTIESMEGK